MVDIKMLKTTDYRLSDDVERWCLSLGGLDYVNMTKEDFIRLRDLIDEVLTDQPNR